MKKMSILSNEIVEQCEGCHLCKIIENTIAVAAMDCSVQGKEAYGHVNLLHCMEASS
jgi:hypothetical protein